MNKNFSTIFDKQRKGKQIDLSFLRKVVTKSVFRQEIGENIVWCRKRGQKCAARNLRFLCAHGAPPHACCFARGFCRDSGNITSDISHIIKKDPVIGFVSGAPLHYWFDYVWSNEACCKTPFDRVRIGCAFVLLIWLCLKQRSLLQRSLLQRSLLQRPLRSGSYRVRLCTTDLIVFEARKHWLRGSDCTGNVWGSDSVNYLHFLYPCWNSLNQGNINILYWFNASCQLLS